MKLESINLEKFKEDSLNETELKIIKAGKALDVGMQTSGGTKFRTVVNGRSAQCDYSYDSMRYDSNDQAFITYHGYTNCKFD